MTEKYVYVVATSDIESYSIIAICGDKDYAVQVMEDAYAEERQRLIDTGYPLDEEIPFGLTVTDMLGHYSVVRYKLDVRAEPEADDDLIGEIDPEVREGTAS